MNNNVIPFDYHGQQVRVTGTKENPLWVLKDVCSVLEITNSRMVAERLDSDELMSVKLTSGGQRREMQAVTESGLYAVILRSDKPEAKPFRKWVTSEVLPSIRKTGSYTVTQDKPHKKALPLASYNHMIEMLTHGWKAAGVDPVHIASMQTGLTRDALLPYGLHVPELPIAVEKSYDAFEMAKALGMMSQASKGVLPANQALSALIKDYINVLPGETFVTETTAHDHGKVVNDVRYTESVKNKVAKWLDEHSWPEVFCAGGKNRKVTYQNHK